MFKRHSQCELSSKAVFDDFIIFLNSPMWNIPIATFLEQYSVVFDDEQNDLLLYHKIHDEFKSMVDVLMEGFCSDLNVETKQLISVLKYHDNSHKLSAKERSLLGPVIAAQNFDVFVPMMIHESIELRLQTIQMIEFLCGVLPTILCIESNDISEEEFGKVLMEGLNREQYNRYIFIKVLRKSEAEFQNEAKKCEKMQLKEAMKASLQTKKQLEECKQKTEDEINTVLTSVFKMHPIVFMQKIDDRKAFSNVADSVITQLSFKDSKKLSKVEDSERQLLNKKEKAEPKDGRELEKSVRKMSSNLHVLSQHSLGHISQSDVEERAAYFRKQRNKITIVGNVAMERPETAKAARIAMSSKSICYTANKEILNKRQILASKLKYEIDHINN
ncbi:The ARF-like 2 binding protein BART family protein [Acanthocheilonema viteae]